MLADNVSPYSLNKKDEQNNQIGFSFCSLYKTLSSLFIIHTALFFVTPLAFWQMKGHKLKWLILDSDH